MARSLRETYVLGLDVGAVSLSLVEVDGRGRPVWIFRSAHHGDLDGCLEAALETRDPRTLTAIGATTCTPSFLRAPARFNDQICLIAGARRLHPEARSVLVVGGERFGLVRFAPDGSYLSYRDNPACAAGTGGFLDQQARRLNLDHARALAALALKNRAAPPKIASRCAVFAKTDLVHAQQEGYDLAAICDGLCRGVARNIVDAVFKGETVHGPLLLVGGVARNQAVVRALRELLDLEIIVDGNLPYGAFGAALKTLEAKPDGRIPGSGALSRLLDRSATDRSYEYPPLHLRPSDPAESRDPKRSLFRGRMVKHSHPLELTRYGKTESGSSPGVYLGVDIGSTSTKGVVTDPEGRALAGFYTATAGKPLVAAQLVLEAVRRWEEEEEVVLDIRGVGTTGAGRKFIGRILGADLVLDEITAHARAAVELHADVDTIIEIGGQDSKFTTLKDGGVTLAVMNSVCAAGTGSFIEEQAKRLGVSLSEYGEKTRGCSSPMASERCTVFMERDLNHYLREGYARGEVLAAVLHSVRENYLNKVAVEALIGENIVFQGATARNTALVAAFEQRLGKPIRVSRYCHLTGALGAALTLADENVGPSTFRGLELHGMSIPVRSETCDICPNHCKLSIAEVAGETVAYGFLCGRDWETRRFVRNNPSGFDLFRARRRAFSAPGRRSRPSGSGRFLSLDSPRQVLARSLTDPERESSREGLTVGLPAALHLFEDLPFWQRFFHRLGCRTVTSEGYRDAVKEGRKLAGAELCAPMTALHGHVRHLLDRADLVFLPFYLEKRWADESRNRKLCYYTQFAPSLGTAGVGEEDQERILTPLLESPRGSLYSRVELYRTLRRVLPGGASPMEVYSAFDEAERARDRGREELKAVYRDRSSEGNGFHVVLLGRPYTVLSRGMNQGIPQTFASLGVRVFYQDMLSWSRDDVRAIAPLLENVHWHYAARILEAAEVTARTPGAYPVLVTSFKCSPDSFVTPYVRQILEGHRKPYLVLELDEHDSRLGYETRIEAAVRAFRNHHSSAAAVPTDRGDVAAGETRETRGFGGFSGGEVQLSGKTVFFPNWDPLSQRLVVAAVRRTGLDARLLEASRDSVRRSLRHNSGQCTPLNIIAQDFMDSVQDQGLDPAQSVLWMISSDVACNIRLYPHHIGNILRAHGGGFERAQVYTGALSLQDITPTLPLDASRAYMFGGFLRRMGCRIRPYECTPGETDQALEEGIRRLERVFEGGGSKEDALADVVSRLESISVEREDGRPKVAIFGDLYARDNQLLNQDLIHFIEAHGGEVITTPYTSYVKMVVRPYYWKWFLEGKYMNVITAKAWMTALGQLEKRYFPYFERILGDPEPEYDVSPQDILADYNVRMEHSGEAMDNLLKVFYIARHHPDVALFVQASPAFCCPSLVTEAMAQDIEEKTGIPMVSVTYDGTGGEKNDVILPYLEYPRTRASA